MQQAIDRHIVETQGQGLYEVTRALRTFVADARIETGLVTAYVRHTSCSLLIQENADPDVQTDLTGFFRRLVPEGMDWLVHTAEGPDDMPSHIKMALTRSSETIPFAGGKLLLGTWQGVFLWEHRFARHRRKINLSYMGE